MMVVALAMTVTADPPASGRDRRHLMHEARRPSLFIAEAFGRT